MLVWAGGRLADIPAPYLMGLMAALVAYVGAAALEPRR
jgi:hypothetical protein